MRRYRGLLAALLLGVAGLPGRRRNCSSPRSAASSSTSPASPMAGVDDRSDRSTRRDPSSHDRRRQQRHVRVPGVAPGRYQVRARIAGVRARSTHPLDVDAALPVELTLRLTLRTSMSKSIVDEAMAPDIASDARVDRRRVDRAGPVRAIARGVQEAVATLPGWATEDNGLLHVRGTDDGFLYVIDGVPVYERLDQLNGLGPTSRTIESINVITGYIPAEFGYKAGGVIDVRSKSLGKRLARHRAGRARQRRCDSRVSAGRAGDSLAALAVTLAANAQQSDRFLDPVHPGQLPQPRRRRRRRGPADVVAIRRELVSASAASGRDGLRRAEHGSAGGRVAGSAAAHQARLRDAVVAARMVVVDLFATRRRMRGARRRRLPAAQATRRSSPMRDRTRSHGPARLRALAAGRGPTRSRPDSKCSA